MQMLISSLGSMIILAMLAASLLWAAAATHLITPPAQTPDVAADAAPSTATAPQLAKPRPGVYYQAITDRPLFSPDRRPQAATEDLAPAPLMPAEAPQTDAPVDVETPTFVLKGIMVNGKLASALIGADDAEPVWAEIGTQVAGWTISAITPDGIDLTLKSNVIHVDLYPK